jgi:hypothetical protein
MVESEEAPGMTMHSKFIDEMPEDHAHLRSALIKLLDGQNIDVALTVLVNTLADLAIEADEVELVTSALGQAIQGKIALGGGAPSRGDA